MNKQEMFTKVWLGLQAQGWRQSIIGTTCRYRGPEGLKCAIGHLIPDDKYQSDWESSSIGYLLGRFPLLVGLHVTQEDVAFLEHLQRAHDQYAIRLELDEESKGKAELRKFDDMRAAFLELASLHNLSVPKE